MNPYESSKVGADLSSLSFIAGALFYLFLGFAWGTFAAGLVMDMADTDMDLFDKFAASVMVIYAAASIVSKVVGWCDGKK